MRRLTAGVMGSHGGHGSLPLTTILIKKCSYMSGMDWTVVPSWIAALAAAIAAFASVAVWWHQRGYIAWKIEFPHSDADRYRVINAGTGTAFKVHLRIGSASDPSVS
jgi:hypothetical protein